MLPIPEGEVRSATYLSGARPERDLLFISGSLIAGFGNPRSDVDLFIVTDDLPSIVASGAPVYVSGHDRGRLILLPPMLPRRWDIEYYTSAVFRGLAETCERVGDPMTSPQDADALSESDLDLLHRLQIAVPVNDPSRLETLRGHFDFARLPRLLAERRMVMYEASADDALGALEGGQLRTAVHCARQALEYSFDALLAASGEAYVSMKWMHEKAKRSASVQPLYQELWRLETCLPREDGASIWVQTVLRLAQRCAFAAADRLDA